MTSSSPSSSWWWWWWWWYSTRDVAPALQRHADRSQLVRTLQGAETVNLVKTPPARARPTPSYTLRTYARPQLRLACIHEGLFAIHHHHHRRSPCFLPPSSPIRFIARVRCSLKGEGGGMPSAHTSIYAPKLLGELFLVFIFFL